MFNDKPGNYSVDQIKHGNYLKIVKVPKWKPKAQNQQPSAHLENYSIHVKIVVKQLKQKVDCGQPKRKMH